MKKYICALFFIIIIGCATVKKHENPTIPATSSKDAPELVVGVVVDQMRYDYLTRFWSDYGENGFKRLVKNGHTFTNAHFNYIPTYTGPGHASIFTGTTPSVHGIIANNWFNKFEDQMVYCAGDPKVSPVGTSSDAGKMSPHRMKTTSVADQNRLHTQMRGKTIGISLKDRGAILPAGHSANAAYWFLGKEEGSWITSTHYMKKLPDWVMQFNTSGKAQSYLKMWKPIKKLSMYSESGPDDNRFEGTFKGKDKAIFPYDLTALKDKNGGLDIIKYTPFGNSLTTDFAIAAIKGEKLGEDQYTDFLTVSYSSTDYIGHRFGVNAVETQDAYVRLDRDIARLLSEIDLAVGKGNYTVFLTADHGGVHVPSYLASRKIPSGYLNEKEFNANIKKYVEKKFGTDSLIRNISNYQIFFNYQVIDELEVDMGELQKKLAHYIAQFPEVDRVFTRNQLQDTNFSKGMGYLIQQGFHQQRSGDVFIVLNPATIAYSTTGSTHGTGFTYDTHVPLLFYGNGINKGKTNRQVEVIDIAPTISSILEIAFPNGATGKVLPEAISKGL
ncbi:alkaline phosphatase family protein [Gangjinia marincola]|uniref:Alkaline phosphatase family protein n=1 Tax=Gangjinia marincola TaxID=578463 RepID=A0ABN1ML12_9FLAO